MASPKKRGQKRGAEKDAEVSPSKRYKLHLEDSEIIKMRRRMSQALVSYFCTHVPANGSAPVEAILQYFIAEGLGAESFATLRNEVFADCLKIVRLDNGDVQLAFKESAGTAPVAVDWMSLFASAQQHLKQESERVAAFKPQIESILAQRTDLQNQVKAQQNKIEQLEADLDQQKAVLLQTIKEASDLQHDLIQEKRDSDALAVAEEDLMRENTDLHHQLTELERELEIKAKELETKERVMNKMAEDLGKQRERKLRADAEQIKALTDRCEALQAELKDTTKAKETLLRGCKELENQMAGLRVELKEAMELRDQRGRYLEQALLAKQTSETTQVALRHEIDDYKAQNERLTRELQNHIMLLAQSKHAAEDMETEFKEAKKQLVLNQESIVSAQQAVDMALADRLTLQAKIKELQGQLETLQAELKETTKAKSHLKAEIKELQGRLETVRAEALNGANRVEGALDRERESAKAIIENLQTGIAELKAQVEEEKHKAVQMGALRKMAAEQAEALKQQLDTAQDKIKELETDALEAEKDGNEAHDAKTEAMELYEQARAKITKLEQEKERLDADKKEQEDKVEDLQTELDAAEAEIEQMEREQKQSIKELLVVRRGFDGSQGCFAVFNMGGGLYWIGWIANVYDHRNGETLVDVVWHEVAGDAGLRVVNPLQYKPLEKGIRIVQIVATFRRAPNTHEQYEQLISCVQAL